ncbi:hypothetical protein IWX83_000766 [Flavobacterium sp. CG_9.1]|uniref:Uncharacterized protein n=1 Tax=Flavobacterium xanthum TaxID=69322 RepID=A0A1M7CB72_9FLAO|nr:hypothetical protein [Flavobacterium sp. CG_9.1]SHL64505.1 hypothetical protein SAMN05443669_10111 [Flavobacterium xanthum]
MSITFFSGLNFISFMTTFFIRDKLYDKKFTFKANSINETNVEEVPILFVDGVIVR